MINFRKISILGLLIPAILGIALTVGADNTITSSSSAISTSLSFSSSDINLNQSTSSSNRTTVSSSSSSSSTDYTQTSDHAMGSSWKTSSGTLSSSKLKSFSAFSSAVNAPDNLSSTDTSLPRKDAVDISSAQWWMGPSDFNLLKNQGVKTVVIKLTEGTYYTNPYAANFIKWATNSGLNIAVYHFAILGNSSDQTTANNEAQKEAQYFVTAAKNLGISPDTAMVFDCEWAGVDKNNVDWTTASLAWSSKMKALGYSNDKYYTSQSWTTAGGGNFMEESQLGAGNMWIAQYLYGTPSASNLKNTQFGAWQYSSQMYYVGASQNQPIDTSIDFSNIFSPTVSSGNIPVYRLYNPVNLEHFYTASFNEATTLSRIGWGYSEGISYYAPSSNGNPVYRLYNPYIQMHLYTTDLNEYNVLSMRGWNQEGVAFYAASGNSGQVPVYRLYNPKILQHLYTTDLNEYRTLANYGWSQEGISWYGVLN